MALFRSERFERLVGPDLAFAPNLGQGWDRARSSPRRCSAQSALSTLWVLIKH